MAGAATTVAGLAKAEMAVYTFKMAISVTEFKHRCLEIIRGVEETGRAVAITRRGKVVARLQPSSTSKAAEALKPWERLRGSATCLFEPEESVLEDEDFEASR
jgi:prevent-host-death family protein